MRDQRILIVEAVDRAVRNRSEAGDIGHMVLQASTEHTMERLEVVEAA